MTPSQQDSDALFNEEATLLRLTEQQTNPLSALQAEVARMSGFIREAFRNHEKQIDETKSTVKSIAEQLTSTNNKVENIESRVQHVEQRLEKNHMTWLMTLSPVVSLLGIIITTYIALHGH